jgi:hypothetical protein
MRRCPKCGYGEGINWPEILLMLALMVMWAAFWGLALTKPGAHASRVYFYAVSGSMGLLPAALYWKLVKETKDKIEYLKLHSGSDRESQVSEPSQ